MTREQREELFLEETRYSKEMRERAKRLRNEGVSLNKRAEEMLYNKNADTTPPKVKEKFKNSIKNGDFSKAKEVAKKEIYRRKATYKRADRMNEEASKKFDEAYRLNRQDSKSYGDDIAKTNKHLRTQMDKTTGRMIAGRNPFRNDPYDRLLKES